MLIPRKKSGFTLIELVIAIAIVGILLGIAIPNYSAFIGNSKVRNAAGSYLTGLQLARTQAVLRNRVVEFGLTSTTVIDGATAAAASLSASGPNWVVRLADASPCASDPLLLLELPQCPLIEAKSALEGSLQKIEIGATQNSILFNGFGARTTAGISRISFKNPSGGACVDAGGAVRCMDVVIAAGGQARVCDPAVSDPADTRHC